MVDQPTLQDARSKLRWATSIFSSLRSEIDELEQLDGHRYTTSVDADSGEYTFYIHDLPGLNHTWGLRIGDCLHSARCALDYLMVGLVAMGTGAAPQDVGDVQFPVYSKKSQFNGAMGELRKNEILAGWLNRVEELQPYNAGNPSIWGWSDHGLGGESMPRLPLGLDRLTVLDNVDKHRCILHPYIGPKFWTSSLELPSGFTQLSGNQPMVPLEEGSVVGRVTFETPLPRAWEPEQEDLKRKYPIQVSFNEPSISKSVIHIIAWCLWAVEATLHIFSPVFEHKSPPRLVTASLPPRPEGLDS